MLSESLPPYYVLVSHPPVLDDLPHALLPRSPGEHVLVLDYDPYGGLPVAQSLSTNLAMTGLKVTDAPGAAAGEEEGPRNNKIYVLETTTLPEDSLDENDDTSPHAMLARFKQRNTVLRAVLDYQHPPEDPRPISNVGGQLSPASFALSPLNTS